MAQAGKTFRIFVSSTFSDLKAERDALQREVFPRLREFCLQHGCRFQAIDLRWGVSEEASLDQQTMKICLEELRRCQRVTPRPNFIVLLGDRYGWRPLPDQIPAPEYEALRDRLAGTPAGELLAAWYRRDDNALYTAGGLLLPGVYALQPRTGRHEDYDRWEGEVERPLGRALAQAARELDLPPAARGKYQASAVTQEIAQGALDPEIANAPGHVFGFCRGLQGLPLDQAATDPQLRAELKKFIDLEDDGRVDEEAQRSLKALRDDLAARLPGNLHFYEAHWRGQGGAGDRSPITTAHLEGLCRDVYDSLSRVILEQIEQLEKTDPVELERAAHEAFGDKRAEHFLGRVAPLAMITDYLAGESSHPLAVCGEGGSGKSALLAQAARAARAAHPQAVVVERFIGATPASLDIRLLLDSLCREISRPYGARDDDLPVEFRKLEEEFHRRLGLATPDNPLILIMDALDQLSDAEQARRLYWLPETLPSYVRLLVSAIPEEIRTILEKKLPAGQVMELTPMTTEEGGELLDCWLWEARRTLQPHQWEEVLSKFAGNGLPLYLKLAFEEARQWRSYDPPGQTRLSPDIPGVIRDLFRRLSEEANHGKMLVSHSLGYLAAGKNGLTEDELLEVLSRDEKVMKNFRDRSPKSPEVDMLPVAVWSRLHFDLEPYLTERQADGAALLAFYHRQLKEVGKKDFLSGPEKPTRHATLAAYFDQQPLYRVKGQQESPNVRKVSELPYQQACGELWGEVEKTLCDPDFLESKVQGNLAFELLNDYGRVRLITQNRSGVEPQLLDGLERTFLLGKVLANVVELVMVDPSSVGVQLHLELQSMEEVPRVKELVRHLETRGKEKPWLKHIHCHGADQVAYLAQIALHHRYVHFLAFSPDSKSLLIMDGSGQLALWRWQEGTISFCAVPEADVFRYATLLSNHQLLLNSEKSLWLFDKPANLWQEPIDEGYWRKLLSAPSGSKLYSISASPQAGYALIAQIGPDGNLLHRIDAASGGISARGRLPAAGADFLINGIAISPDGSLRAICFGDGELLLSTGFSHLAHWGGAFDCTFIKGGGGTTGYLR